MREQSVCEFCGGTTLRPLNSFGPRCLVGDYRITTGYVENVWCTACGLGWNRRMMDEEELAAFYAGYMKKVGVEDEDDLLFGPSDAEIETLTASQVKFLSGFVPSSGRMLDIGCGKGAVLAAFQTVKPSWQLAGVEPSREEATLARRHAAFDIHEGMFGAVDFGKEAFDLVTIMHVLEHVSSPASVLLGIYDVLKPGGIAFIEVPNVLDLNMFYDLLLFEHLYHFCPATLSWQLKRTGFELVAVDTSSSYGALRIIARKQKADGAEPSASGFSLAEAFAGWSDLWSRMRAVSATGAARARQGRRVGIFGAGMTSATWLVYTDLNDASIVGCVDESPWKIGRPFFGRSVHALSEIDSLHLDTLLVATMPSSQTNVLAKLKRVVSPDLDILSL